MAVTCQSQQSAFFFDRIEVRPACRQVLADGRVVPLGARAFDVLMTLIERRDRTVSKQELLDAVWADSSVEEHNVVVQVGNLRRLFGAHAISTIPGRGYRFTAAPAPAAQARAGGEEGAAGPALELVGRDTDLARLRRMLPAHRLVTIAGAAGVGKTRVARALMAVLRPLYAHGVSWVELGLLRDGSQLPAAIARSIGTALPAADPVAGLVATVRPSNLLLVLDSAGHLVDSLARVAESLLRETVGVQLVVTSRVPMGLPMEQVHRLEPLGQPADEAANPAPASAYARRVVAAMQPVLD